MKLFVNKPYNLFLGLFLISFFTLFFFVSQGYAQYFGRNKVQYEDFNFQVLESEHFSIYHYTQENLVAQDAANMLERWYARYSDLFEFGLSRKQPIIIYANNPDFQQTNVISGIIPQGTRGITEGMRNRIVLPMTGIYSENDHVLGHELVHAFQYDVMRRRGRWFRSARRLPLWLVEGMSEYLTKGRKDSLTAMWMRDAVLNDDVPSIQKIIRNRRYFPYRYGHALWTFIAGNWGDEVVMPLFIMVMHQGWERGVKAQLEISSDSLSSKWQNAIKSTYSPQIKERTKPSEVGKAIVKESGYNLAPSISHDGKYFAFISQQGLFTLDLYLGNAQTGEIIKKLVSSRTNVHFDNLRFMNSSGAWSPDSKTFAFIVTEDGDNHIAFLDIDSTEIKRTVKPKGVDAIMHLAWAPNGESIAFSGISGGIGNLYLMDVATEKLTQLTDDRYAETQPAWAPDSKSIAFVTDRGQLTELDELKFRSLNIGLMDVDTRNIDLISITSGIKHVNPQFSPEGDSLYFTSNPDGFSNIYRYSFTQKKFYRITNIATGVIGLTENSPAMSLARNTGRLVFSVFENHEYHIYGLEKQKAQGELFSINKRTYARNTALPPVESSDKGIVKEYLDEPEIGLRPESKFAFHDYEPSLQLFYAGFRGTGIVTDRTGVEIGSGVNFLFGDMLGNQILSVTAQIQGEIEDIGGELVYLNRDHQLNWGGSIGHIPYRRSDISVSTDTISDGQKGIVFTETTRRTFIDKIALITEYPFSRNQRIEFSGAAKRISYDWETEITETTFGGRVVDVREKELETPSPINLLESSMAYVEDYSVYGFTSPLDGRRFRFEVSPTFGNLRYLSALADYRHYHFLRPFSLAFRLLHYGRYLKDAEDDRLDYLFLGFETWIRGYSSGSFDVSEECTQQENTGGCPEIARLVGSRVGVLNAELRFPLTGAGELGLLEFPYLPITLVGFFDGGIAWTKNEQPKFSLSTTSPERIPVFSTGIATRFNILGFLVAQFYYAYPFQRPNKGAHFGFIIAPGW